MERALQAKLTTHLGYEKHSPEGHGSGNSRNGVSAKQLKGEFGTVQIEVPRDRQASFEPKLVPKGETRFQGFDDKILSLYARHDDARDPGPPGRDLPGGSIAGADLERDRCGDRIGQGMAVAAPGCGVYPIVYLDALVVKMRTDGRVENRAVYVAIGIALTGQKEVLGLWTSANEGAKFWLQVLTEMQNRGLKDIFIACVDGLKGFPPGD